MSYTIEQNVKKSLIQYITDLINQDASFVCGDGASMITLLDSFPTNPATFKIPSGSAEIERDLSKVQYDLGCQCTRRYECAVNFWFDNKPASDYIPSMIKEKLEKQLMEYRDYTFAADGASIIGYMFPRNVIGAPIRSPLPGNEGNYRHELTFILEYNTTY
jgi:hypothetical protein